MHNHPPCRATAWNTLSNTHGTPIETTWEEWFSTFDLGPSPRYLGDFKHPGWSAAIFEPLERSKANACGLSALVLDYDSEGTSLDEAAAHWNESYGLIHTTRRHKTSAPRFRVILPLSRIVTIDEYEIIWEWAESVARGAGHSVDPATKDPSRYWYLPGSKTGDPYEVRRLIGNVIDPDPILTSHLYATNAAASSIAVAGQASRYGTRALESACDNVRRAPKGKRNIVLNTEAFSIARLVAGGVVDDASARADLRAAGLASGLALSEVTGTLGSAFSAGMKDPRKAPELRAVAGGGGVAHVARTGTYGPAPVPTMSVATQILKLGDHVELAAVARARLETSPLTHDDGAFWRYEPSTGVWRQMIDEVVESAVAGLSGSLIDTSKGYKALSVTAGTCIGSARLIKNSIVSAAHPEFKHARNGIAFRDRFVTVVDGEIRFHEHSPDHLQRAGLPFDYDPLEHPQLDAFFDDLFEGCDDAKDRVSLLQEFIGASLLGMATSYQRCLVLYGTGNNGKSQVIDIARAAFPDGSVAALSPQQWDERFKLSMLVGALANFVGELPNREIASSETFKGVVTGDEQTTERKNKDGYTFTPRAGHMFACNDLPRATDLSSGWFRRFMILPLTRVFPESGQGVERDIGKRIAREERQAIAAWAVEGAARVQRQCGYTSPASVGVLKDKWSMELDTVRTFLSESVDKYPEPVAGGGYFMRHAEIYQMYASWAQAIGLKPVSGITFSKRYIAAGYRHTVTNGTARFYVKKRYIEGGVD